jgi:hypothetical protein
MVASLNILNIKNELSYQYWNIIFWLKCFSQENYMNWERNSSQTSLEHEPRQIPLRPTAQWVSKRTCGREDNIKLDQNRMKCKVVDVILVAHDRVKSRASANMDAQFSRSSVWLLANLWSPRLCKFEDKAINECEAVGGTIISRGNRSTQRKCASLPLCPPQIPQHLH